MLVVKTARISALLLAFWRREIVREIVGPKGRVLY
jgi:hypothetical protein